MHIHFIIHESFEAPGAILQWAEQRKYTLNYSRVYKGEQLPKPDDDLDMLVVMGGPQSPDTTTAQCAYFDAEAEKAVIRQCVHQHKVVLGICLGAQLIGEALGAKYKHSPQKEIGSFPITLTGAGKQDDKLAHFDKDTIAGHWHEDMPGLTADSKIIAFSEGCPRQIISYSSLVYGFQCHLEFTPELIEKLIMHSKEDLSASAHLPFVQSPKTLRRNSYKEMNEKLFTFLDKITAAYLTRIPLQSAGVNDQ